MANVNNPNGFNYVSVGKPYPPRTRVFNKLVGSGTAIFQNDVVYSPAGSSGQDQPPVASFNDGTAVVGTTIPQGVAVNFGSASLATRHSVIVDLDAEYQAQDNDPTTGMLATDMGKNANLDKGSVAGSSTTGFSGMQLDKSGVTAVPSTSATAFEFHLLKRWLDVFNAYGPNCRVLVKFNKEREATATVGV